MFVIFCYTGTGPRRAQYLQSLANQCAASLSGFWQGLTRLGASGVGLLYGETFFDVNMVRVGIHINKY